MEAEEEGCTLDRQLVSLVTKPVYRSLLRAILDEVITDKHEYVLTSACCVRGEVTELVDCFPDGSDVRHVLRVDHAVRSQQSKLLASSTRRAV